MGLTSEFSGVVEWQQDRTLRSQFVFLNQTSVYVIVIRGLVENGESGIFLRDLDSVVMHWGPEICTYEALKWFCTNSHGSCEENTGIGGAPHECLDGSLLK